MWFGQIVQQQLTGHNMRVKMITMMAGVNGNANPGDEIEVSEKQADELISGGFALPVKSVEIETAVIKESENAAIIPQKVKGKK